MQRLKIDLAKFAGVKSFTSKEGVEFVTIPIKDNHFFTGAKGTYMDLTLMDNRDGGTDQYGNDGFITLDVGKEKREAGVKGPIIGNWKHIGQRQSAPTPPSQTAADDDSEIPF